MKIANLREAAMEWTVTIEGPDEFGEINPRDNALRSTPDGERVLHSARNDAAA
jgi:hypothetical protein